jgi:hypothetical protein
VTRHTSAALTLPSPFLNVKKLDPESYSAALIRAEGSGCVRCADRARDASGSATVITLALHPKRAMAARPLNTRVNSLLSEPLA